MLRKFIFSSLLSAGITVFSGGIGIAQSVSTDAPIERQITPLDGARVKIRIALSPANIWTLPLIYGVDRGYFSKANLEVDITKSNQPSIMFAPLLARGDFDILPQTPAPSFYNLANQNFNVKAISVFTIPKAGRADAAWLTVMDNKADTIKELADLKGKVVEAGSLGTTANFLALTALKEAGLKPGTDVTVRSRAKTAGDFLPVIKSRDQDVVAVIEPTATQAESEGYVKRWKTISDIAPWFQSALLVSSEQFLQKNGPAMQKFLEVYLLSCRDVNASNGAWTENLLRVMTQWTGISGSTIRSMGGVPYCDPNGEMSETSLERAQQLWIESGALQRPIDINKMIDAAPVASTLKVIGRVQ